MLQLASSALPCHRTFRLNSVFRRLYYFKHSRISVIFLRFHNFNSYFVSDKSIFYKKCVSVNLTYSLPCTAKVGNLKLELVILITHKFFFLIHNIFSSIKPL